MNELAFNFDEDTLVEAEATGGSFGTLDTGIYDVTINFASLGKSKKGNNTLALDITTADGHQTTIWGAFGTIDRTWSSGAENFRYGTFQALMAAVGAKSITPTPYQLKKDDGTLIKDLSVIKELHGKTCKLAIQKVLDVYNGEVTEKNEIHSCYNNKGQTYLEVKSNTESEKLAKVASRLQDKLTKEYKAMGSMPATGAPIEDDIDVGSLL